MTAATSSPSSSSSTPTTPTTNPNFFSSPNPNNTNNHDSSNSNPNPIQSYYTSISRSRSSIQALSTILSSPSISSLSDSDNPSLSLLSSSAAFTSISSSLSTSSLSGSSDSPLCRWLYDSFLSPDPDLKLVVLSFLPSIVHLYLSRLLSDPYSCNLAGFESVILTVYQAETRARNGKAVTVSVPDLRKPSMYHSPKNGAKDSEVIKENIGVMVPPLEPQNAIKSTKRSAILGVVLDCYFNKIAKMPVQSKVDFCGFVVCWAGQDCECRYELDDEESNSYCVSNFEEGGSEKCEAICNGVVKDGCRVPLPWEMMQPILRILGHCLLAPRNVKEVREAGAAAVRSVYARAMHDLMPQAILASRSLIQLDKSSRKDGSDAMVMGGMVSNPTTPCKPKKPEMLLVSK